jgi:hypothetical protein
MDDNERAHLEKEREYIKKAFEDETGSTGVYVTYLTEIEGIGVIVIGDDDHCALWVQQSGSDDDEFIFHRADDASKIIVVPLMDD